MKEENPSEIILRYVSMFSAIVSTGGAWKVFIVLCGFSAWKRLPRILGYNGT
jgi:hypothetical protein